MSWHRVQHTPSMASIHDTLSSLYSHGQELTSESSFSFPHGSLPNQPPSAHSPWVHGDIVTSSRSHSCELAHSWMESQHPAHHPLTTSKYSSNLGWLQPPSVSPNFFHHSLHLDHYTSSINASKYIIRTLLITACKFTRSWTPSASPHSLNYGILLYISKLASLQPPSVSPNLNAMIPPVRMVPV